MERHSVLEAQVLQEGSACQALDNTPFTLRGEIRTRQDRHGRRMHQFFHSSRPDPPNVRNVAHDLALRDEDELIMVNGLPVSHWDHCILTLCLAKLPLTDNQELVFVVRRLDGKDNPRYVFIELSLSFAIIGEQGLSDHVVRVLNVVLKITERIATVDIIDIHFTEEESVIVKHAAIASHYLNVGDDKSLAMAPLNTAERQAYCFKWYKFRGVDGLHDNNRVYLCALQSELTGGFLTAQLHTNQIRLTEGQDVLDTDIRCLTKPDPRLFRLTAASDGGRFVLRSVLYDNYYLYYDAQGIRLKRCNPKPLDLTNFLFDFCKKP